MRVLALDYGRARCGCAVSDPTGVLASPIEAVRAPATRRGLARLRTLVREHDVGKVVVGLPVTLSGRDSAQTAETREFAARLGEELPVPVELYDERFTTRLAQRSGGKAQEDSRAAAHLLESWLASQPTPGGGGAGAQPGGGGAGAQPGGGGAGAEREGRFGAEPGRSAGEDRAREGTTDG